jgi:hypothetical protein
MDHAEMYARLGQVVSKALFEHLSKTGALPAPGDQSFRLAMLNEPHINRGGWFFTFDVALPRDEGTLMFMVSQMGSGFDHEKVTLPLPPKDFEDPSRREFPPEHQDAFFKLLDEVEAEFERRGLTRNGDLEVNPDYYPSRGITVWAKNPKVFSKDLVRTCQAMLQNRPFSFWICFDLCMEEPEYKGKNEALLIREDRIVEDWNVDRLRQEFPARFTW